MTRDPASRRRALRTCVVGLVGLSIALTFAHVARAAAPNMSSGSFDVESDISTICPFSVHQTGHIVYRERDFVDASGRVVRSTFSVTEQDTFSAHGITLTSDAYHYSLFQAFDAQGNFTEFEGVGVIARIPLPDGTIFLSAGKGNLLPNPDQFFFTPDVGASGDITAFCNALSS